MYLNYWHYNIFFSVAHWPTKTNKTRNKSFKFSCVTVWKYNECFNMLTKLIIPKYLKLSLWKLILMIKKSFWITKFVIKESLQLLLIFKVYIIFTKSNSADIFRSDFYNNYCYIFNNLLEISSKEHPTHWNLLDTLFTCKPTDLSRREIEKLSER